MANLELIYSQQKSFHVMIIADLSWGATLIKIYEIYLIYPEPANIQNCSAPKNQVFLSKSIYINA